MQKDSVSGKFQNSYDANGNYLATFFNPADCKIFASKTSLGKPKEPRVAIFTLTKDRIEYTKRMAEAMFRTAGYPFDWFVIDQGSKDGTQEWLVKCENKNTLISLSENVGIAKGWNLAIEKIKEAGSYDFVIKIDNDAELMTDGWLAMFVDLWSRNRRLVLSPYVEGLEDSPGGVLRKREDGGMPYVLIGDRILGLVPFLGGICWGSAIELYDNFKFEENSFYTGGKDYMISQYAGAMGYGLAYVEECRLWHMDGTEGQKKKYPEYFALREKELTTKYGDEAQEATA